MYIIVIIFIIIIICFFIQCHVSSRLHENVTDINNISYITSRMNQLV